MRGQHDLGGLPAGPIDPTDQESQPWEKLVNATFLALRSRRVATIDELRRHLEDLPAEQYDRPYFERWAEAIANLLEEKGVLSRAEIADRMSAIAAKLDRGT
jgi:hypothetical protein